MKQDTFIIRPEREPSFKKKKQKVGPQIWTGDHGPPIQLCVLASSAMELQLRVFRFLPTTPAKTNASNMRPQFLRVIRYFASGYLFAQTTVDASHLRTWRMTVMLITGKTQIPYAGKKMAQILVFTDFWNFFFFLMGIIRLICLNYKLTHNAEIFTSRPLCLFYIYSFIYFILFYFFSW